MTSWQADAVDVSPSITAVLPAHNEERVIHRTVEACVDALRTLTQDYEVIVVDDGSTDHTGEIVDSLAARDGMVRALHNRPQRGYGGALITGFKAASKELLFFMDSDGQFDVSDVRSLLGAHRQGWRVVLGYRSRRRDPVIRLVNGWAWNQLVGFLYGLRVRDVDCGFKLYESALVRSLDVSAQGATVNVEMLVKLTRMGVGFCEVPVHHNSRVSGRATGADAKVILRALSDLIRLAGKVESWTQQRTSVARNVVVSQEDAVPASH